jgi:crotonobetainyl-CoA:carnitine CoA-transferase CaiB-like acyl-CoA transferase
VICDKIAGLHLAIGVLAGIQSRNRTGASVCIEAPMFESMVAFLFVELLGGKTFAPPVGGIGYHRLNSPFRKPFRTRDGYLSILPYTTGQWQRFLRLAGRDDLAADDRVCDSNRRSQNIDELYGLIASVAPSRSTAEWRRLLGEQDIPCANVNRPEELLEHPHLRDVGLFQPFEHPSEGPLLGIRSPLQVTGAPTAPDRPAPALGRNSEEILREAGFTPAEIASLVGTGAVQLFEP